MSVVGVAAAAGELMFLSVWKSPVVQDQASSVSQCVKVCDACYPCCECSATM